MNDMDLSGFTKKQAEGILAAINQAAGGLITQDEMIRNIKREGAIEEVFDANGLGITG